MNNTYIIESKRVNIKRYRIRDNANNMNNLYNGN